MSIHKIRKVLLFEFSNANVNLFLYLLYFNSSWRVLLFINANKVVFFFLQIFFNPIVIHVLSTFFYFYIYNNDWTTFAEQIVNHFNKIIISSVSINSIIHSAKAK